MDLTPCERDFQRTGREWTELDRPRKELAVMAECCGFCPERESCLAIGLAGHRDAGGRYVEPATGVWGGLFFRGDGRAVDPCDPSTGSIYRHVHRENRRNLWKAERQVTLDPYSYRKVHLGYFHSEEDAAAAVQSYEQGERDDAA